jgi:hypothetical protein
MSLDSSIRIVLAAVLVHVLFWVAERTTGHPMGGAVVVVADIYAVIALLRAAMTD